MSETARSKWFSLSAGEREVVDQCFLAVLEDSSKVLIYGVIEVTQRFEQGFRTIRAVLVESEDCFFALGVYETKVPFVLDIVVKGEVCILSH